MRGREGEPELREEELPQHCNVDNQQTQCANNSLACIIDDNSGCSSLSLVAAVFAVVVAIA